MQHTCDWMPALAIEPGSLDATGTSEPGSRDAKVLCIFTEPDLRDAKGARGRACFEGKIGLAEHGTGNQSLFLSSLVEQRRKPNKWMLHLASLAGGSVYP